MPGRWKSRQYRPKSRRREEDVREAACARLAPFRYKQGSASRRRAKSLFVQLERAAPAANHFTVASQTFLGRKCGLIGGQPRRGQIFLRRSDEMTMCDLAAQITRHP